MPTVSTGPGQPGPPAAMLPWLAPFVTEDSVWHTYHVLLEDGVRQLEKRQAPVLRQFSARLLQAARTKSRQPPDPKINDQLLLSDQYAHFAAETGMRVDRSPPSYPLRAVLPAVALGEFGGYRTTH